jgi:hypothetical protein
MGISVPLPMSKKDEPYPLGGVPAVKEEMRPQKK